MGFFDKNIKNWTSVIQNQYDGDLLICRHPEENFNNNSTLIVSPNEEAIFIKNGNIEQVFENGTYNLTAENYPFISDIRSVFSGGSSGFTCSVYFVRKAHSIEIKWGTDSPLQLRDPVLNIMTSVAARGAYKVKIENGALLLTKMLGNNIDFLEPAGINKYFVNEFQQHIKSSLANAIIELNKEILGINAYQTDIAERTAPKLQHIFEAYGIKLITFSIAGIDISENDVNRQKLEEAFANKQVMNILGKDWNRQQASEILHSAAENEGGIAGIGASLGMGLSAGAAAQSMSKEIMQNSEDTKICPNCSSELKRSSKFCSECGYKFAVKKFCTNCGSEISAEAKFCDNCGFKQ